MSERDLDLSLLRRRVALHIPRRAPELGRPAAVLVPLLPRADGLHLLFTERSAALKTHAGQISFPGGKREPGDADERAAALREAQEEVGLASAHVEIIGALDDCPTFVSGFVISPVVAIVEPVGLPLPEGAVHPQGPAAQPPTPQAHYPWRPSSGEVVRLHELPVSGFLDPAALRVEERETAGIRYELYWYTVEGTVVWGATARIVHQLLEIAQGRPQRRAPGDWRPQGGKGT